MAERFSVAETTALADAFSDPIFARLLLDRAGLPRRLHPAWNAGNAEVFWSEVSRLVGDGALPDGRARILAAARAICPSHPAFHDSTTLGPAVRGSDVLESEPIGRRPGPPDSPSSRPGGPGLDEGRRGDARNRMKLSAATGDPAVDRAAGPGVDFFVSYTQPDEAWALWAAAVLEADGRSVAVQAWDSLPGQNFVAWISEQMATAGRTVALCSAAYFDSHWCTHEWTSALAGRKLIPLRVEECGLPPVLAPITYSDLFGVDETVARRRVLEAVGLAKRDRRSRGFPGVGSPPVRAAFPGRSVRGRTIKVVTASVVSLGVAAGAAFGAVHFAPSLFGGGSSAPEIHTGTYRVTLAGSVSNSGPFDIQGELRVRRPGPGTLPWQFCLKVGSPYGNPSPGAIWYGTDTSCFGATLRDPLVTVRTDGDEVVLEPVGTYPKQAQVLPVFTATSGLLSCWFTVNDGQLRLGQGTGGLSGTVNLRGLDSCGTSAQGTLTARLDAQRVSDDPDTIISAPGPDVTASPSPRPTAGQRYIVSNILEFNQTIGNPAWKGSEEAKVAGTVLVVDTKALTFEWSPPNSATDLFPIQGGLTPQGFEVYHMSGGRQSGTGTTFAEAQIVGTLDLSGQEPTAQVVVTTRRASAESYNARVVLKVA